MANGIYRVAVDIGSSKVTVLITRNNDVGKPERFGFATVPCDGMRAGKIESITSVATAARQALIMAEQDAGVRVKSAYFSISNENMRSANKRDNVLKQENMEVVKADSLTEALKIAGNSDLANDEEVLHITPKHYIIDGTQIIRKPLGVHAREMDIESNVIMAKKDDISNLRSVAREMGIKVERFISHHLASSRACLSTDEMQSGCALIDIGAGTSDLIVFRDNVPDYIHTIGVGGYQCSNDLSLALGIPFHEAEHLKVTHGASLPEAQSVTDKVKIRPEVMEDAVEISKRDVAQLLKDRVQEIFQLLQHRLDNYASSDKDAPTITNVVITGGCTELADFTRLAKYVLQRGVRVGTPAKIGGFSDDELKAADAGSIGMILWAVDNLKASQEMAVPSTTDEPRPQKRGLFSKIFGRN